MKPRMPTSRNTRPTTMAAVWIGERSRITPPVSECVPYAHKFWGYAECSSIPANRFASGQQERERDCDERCGAEAGNLDAMAGEQVVHAWLRRDARERRHAEEQDRQCQHCDQ